MRVSYRGYYIGLPCRGREFDSLHPLQIGDAMFQAYEPTSDPWWSTPAFFIVLTIIYLI